MRRRAFSTVGGATLFIAAAGVLAVLSLIMPSRYVLSILLLGVIVFGVLFESETGKRFTRKQRKKRGQCVQCGYDLRGSPDRCPECGAIPVNDREK